MFEKSVQGIGNTALAEYERVRWETLELLLDPKDHEVLIDGVMTPLMRQMLWQVFAVLEIDEENSFQFIETVCQYMPKALTEKLGKKKKESFFDGIRRMKEAASHLLRVNKLPTVDRLLHLLDKADVEGVDWSWQTEEDFDDDFNVVQTRRVKKHTGRN